MVANASLRAQEVSGSPSLVVAMLPEARERRTLSAERYSEARQGKYRTPRPLFSPAAFTTASCTAQPPLSKLPCIFLAITIHHRAQSLIQKDGERGCAGKQWPLHAARSTSNPPPHQHPPSPPPSVRARHPPSQYCAGWLIVPLYSMSLSSTAPMLARRSPSQCNARPCARTASSSLRTARARSLT